MKRVYTSTFAFLISLFAMAQETTMMNTSALISQVASLNNRYNAISLENVNSKNGYVHLKWTVENETENCAVYEIERRNTDGSFKTVAYVLPNEAGVKMPYMYKEKVKSVKVYYRIKQVSKSGEVTYSDVQASFENVAGK